MTSSNYLRSGLRKSVAFPIMLAAVGLLLASLVFGTRSDLVHALGENDVGVCGYSDLMRAAILANNGDESYDCDRDAAPGTIYRGTSAANSWGGFKVDGDDIYAPNDLDLSDKGLTSFAPLKGELDGFVPGSRVDLRGNGLTVADLDVSAALGTFETDTGGTPDRAAVNRFGVATEGGTGAPIGLTFLLDGGSTTSNGLSLDSYEGTEGGLVWLTFEYGAGDDAFVNPPDSDVSVWLRVTFTITDDDETRTVSAMISSNDAAGTLYAIPFKIPDDSEIEKTKTEDVDVAWGDFGSFDSASDGDNTDASDIVDGDGAAYSFGSNAFLESLARNADEAELTVIDEDTPAVSVNDRQDAVSSAISDFFDIRAGDVGKDHLAGKTISVDVDGTATDRNLQRLLIGAAASDAPTGDAVNNTAISDDTDAIDSITVADLAGLTGLTLLDLSGNEIADLPSGLFAEVGTDGDGDLSTRIDLTGDKMGPTGDGFTLENLGAIGGELSAGQYLVVKSPRKDDRAGFLQTSYEAVEGGVLVIDLNIRTQDDTADVRPVIQFRSLPGDTGKVSGDDKDVKNQFIDLANLDPGAFNYRIAIGLPENTAETGDNTLTAIFGHIADTAGNPNTLNTDDDENNDVNLSAVVDIAPITIRDASYEAPVDVPVVPESSFDSVVVTQNEYIEDPTGMNQNLKHNVSNFLVTIGDDVVNADFLDVYNATGGSERWGLPTSEVVEIPGIGLTQFFQRGALHLESNAEVKRLLAWDYVGGGLGGSVDQQVEPAPDTGPEGGVQQVAPNGFDHYVANVDADGNATGFLDFFNRLGGVDAFGYAKTEARADTGAEGTLMEPGKTPGFTRQYFQAAVFELGPDGSPRLTLLGDTLRDILVPNHAEIEAFNAADPLMVSAEVSPPVIDS